MTSWLHIVIHTYGTWLPGDPRGHRTRHHRQHVPGDVNNPPPDTPQRRAHHAYAKRLMKRPPVILTPRQRERVAHELRASLERHGCEVRILCVHATHAHILARLPEPTRKPTDPDPWAFSRPRPHAPTPKPTDSDPWALHIRKIMGIAKKDAARALSDAGLAPPGGLWSKRGLARPIRDEAHLAATIEYIQRHEDEDATLA